MWEIAATVGVKQTYVWGRGEKRETGMVKWGVCFL